MTNLRSTAIAEVRCVAILDQQFWLTMTAHLMSGYRDAHDHRLFRSQIESICHIELEAEDTKEPLPSGDFQTFLTSYTSAGNDCFCPTR
jgi:hypothetical protein